MLCLYSDQLWAHHAMVTTSGAQAQPLGGIQPRAQACSLAGMWASPVHSAEERKRQKPLGRACRDGDTKVLRAEPGSHRPG